MCVYPYILVHILYMHIICFYKFNYLVTVTSYISYFGTCMHCYEFLVHDCVEGELREIDRLYARICSAEIVLYSKTIEKYNLRAAGENFWL